MKDRDRLNGMKAILAKLAEVKVYRGIPADDFTLFFLGDKPKRDPKDIRVIGLERGTLDIFEEMAD